MANRPMFDQIIDGGGGSSGNNNSNLPGGVKPDTSADGYNLFFNYRLLTNLVATWPNTNSYPQPKTDVTQTGIVVDGCYQIPNFINITEGSSLPHYIRPRENKWHGTWGDWNLYKVAENKICKIQWYGFESTDNVIEPYKFVRKQSAPLLEYKSTVDLETMFTPFKTCLRCEITGVTSTSIYCVKLKWSPDANDDTDTLGTLTVKTYASADNFDRDSPANTFGIDSYGCFVMFCGSGGGGGGGDQKNGIGGGKGCGGSGGGGGATALVYLDLYALYKESSNGYIKITNSIGGVGGNGGSGSEDGDGQNGGNTKLEYFNGSATTAIYTITAGGGQGGKWCAWDADNPVLANGWKAPEGPAGGNGGSVTTSGTSKDFIHLLYSVSGTDGGRGSGTDKGTAGESISTVYSYDTPFYTSDWKVYFEDSDRGVYVGKGQDTGNTKQGGGGACAMGAVGSDGNYRTDPDSFHGYGGCGGSTESNGTQGKRGLITILGTRKSS